MKRVLIVGGANLDLTAVAPRLPGRGETVLARAYRELPGGKAANVACAAAVWGADVSFVGRVGDDAFGDTLLAAWRDIGVDTAHVRRDPAGTGLGMVFMDARGDYQTLVVPRANDRLDADDVATLPATLWDEVGVVALALEAPVEAMVATARAALNRRLPLVLNAAPAEGMVDDLWLCASHLVVNEHEAVQLTGLDVGGPGDAMTAASALLERMVAGRGEAVVVTLGARGAVLARTDEKAEHVAAPTVEAVDSLGAGDTFVGVLVAEVAAGCELRAAVEAACRAGAAAVTVEGARAGVTRERAQGVGNGAKRSLEDQTRRKGVEV